MRLLTALTFLIVSGCTNDQPTDAVDKPNISNQPEVFSVQVVGQDTMTKVRYYYESGDVQAIQERTNGIRRGIEKYFYPNGILKYEIYYIGDQPWSALKGHSIDGKELDLGTLWFGTGSWNLYYDDGTPQVKGFWNNNAVDSIWTYYYPNGQVEREVNWNNGIQQGVAKQYFKNGQLATIQDWKDGKQVSERRYHENGNLYHHLTFKEGLYHGKCIKYYEDGQTPKQVQEFKYGKSNGILISYYRNGQVEYEGQMENGRAVGLWKHYSPDGELIEEKELDSETLKEIEISI